MKNKCKRLATFPTNKVHKALVSLNNQTFYGVGSLTTYAKNLSFIKFSVLHCKTNKKLEILNDYGIN